MEAVRVQPDVRDSIKIHPDPQAGLDIRLCEGYHLLGFGRTLFKIFTFGSLLTPYLPVKYSFLEEVVYLIMRFNLMILFIALALSCPLYSAEASPPAVEALGGATLVLEDETTVLSLFNLGNPAAAAFLPPQDRLDLLVRAEQGYSVAEFTTCPLDASIIIETDGNTLYCNLDPFGNTLPPDTTYTSKTGSFFSSFNDWQNTGYGGYLAWLNQDIIFQILPQGFYHLISSSDEHSNSNTWAGGGKIRAAAKIFQSLALGAGFSYQDGRSSQEGGLIQLDPFGSLMPGLKSEITSEDLSWGAELGAAWRHPAVFDPEDYLALGLSMRSQRNLVATTFAFDTILFPGFASPSGLTYSTSLPWEIQLESIYHYKQDMDIGFVIAYREEKQYLSWESAFFPDQPELVTGAMSNLDYELSFRVRLPMIREDDLRFGVVFNNQGKGHSFPGGRLQTTDLATLALLPPIDTASSSIGIGTAFVPTEESIVAMEYRLGSTKSRQENDTGLLADSGFTNFAFGAQYQLVKNLFLRLGFTTQQLSYELEDSMVIRTTNTATLRFGIGIKEGSFRADLAAAAERVTHSPEGWTFKDKPPALQAVDKDSTLRMSGLLSLSWRY